MSTYPCVCGAGSNADNRVRCECADAIREMWRADESLASSSQQKGVKDVHMYTHLQMHLFRAQRNFYITGFSLFLLMWVAVLTSQDMSCLSGPLTIVVRRHTIAGFSRASTASCMTLPVWKRWLPSLTTRERYVHMCRPGASMYYGSGSECRFAVVCCICVFVCVCIMLLEASLSAHPEGQPLLVYHQMDAYGACCVCGVQEYYRMVDENKTLGEKVKKLDSSLKEATDGACGPVLRQLPLVCDGVVFVWGLV
eukprot:Opistho-2@34091